MLSAFLLAFSDHVVRRLVEDEQLSVREEASTDDVVAYVTDYLANRAQGNSLISSFSKALLSCDDVDELFADDEAIKEVVDAMPRTVLPR